MRNFLCRVVSVVGLLCLFMQASVKGTNDPVETSLPERPLVVCFGDSLTQRGYPQELQKILHVRVMNAGVGGNTSKQGLARIEKDVLSHHPDVVVFLFGTNDSRRDNPGKQQTSEQYRSNLVMIVDRCQAVGAKVVIGVSPPIVAKAYFGRHPENTYAAVGGFETYVEKFRDAARSVGQEKNLPIVDLGVLMKKYPNWVLPDGVHPTEEGNKIFARLVAEKVGPILKLRNEKK